MVLEIHRHSRNNLTGTLFFLVLNKQDNGVQETNITFFAFEFQWSKKSPFQGHENINKLFHNNKLTIMSCQFREYPARDSSEDKVFHSLLYFCIHCMVLVN